MTHYTRSGVRISPGAPAAVIFLRNLQRFGPSKNFLRFGIVPTQLGHCIENGILGGHGVATPIPLPQRTVVAPECGEESYNHVPIACGGWLMSARATLIGLVIVAIVPFPATKNKQVLPDYVLQAETVAVVIPPGAGEPVANPTTKT